MDFLERLDELMQKNSLNKSTLSKACNIPYTTIDGWYKKGYEGLKLTTLRKLASYFNTTLDFWAAPSTTAPTAISFTSSVSTRITEKLPKLKEDQLESIEKRIDIFIDDNEVEAREVMAQQMKKVT